MKVNYKTETSINMLGDLEQVLIPTCPACDEVTYGEDTCPFCRMKGITTSLEYEGKAYPERINKNNNETEIHCNFLQN